MLNLPKIDQPVYEVKLLSRKTPVKYRPFLVKEQKIMMMAVESHELDSTIRAIKQIISNCVLDKINVDELPLADLETLFINLRAKSMGEILNLYYKCTNMVRDENATVASYPSPQMKECGMPIEVNVDLNAVKQINSHLSSKIMINDEVGVIMKYPSLDMIDKLLKANDRSMIFTITAACIDQIFDKENVYKSKDATTEEMVDFVENLPTEAFSKLEEFIDNVPRSRYETTQKCGKCGYEHTFVLEGLSDFFT